MRKYSKFNISFTLGFKFTKSLQRNLAHLWLSNCTKKFASIFLKFSVLILLNFLWQNCSIFLHQVGLSIMKPPWSTLLIEFQYGAKSMMGATMVWEILNLRNKTNNVPSLIDRFELRVATHYQWRSIIFIFSYVFIYLCQYQI